MNVEGNQYVFEPIVSQRVLSVTKACLRAACQLAEAWTAEDQREVEDTFAEIRRLNPAEQHGMLHAISAARRLDLDRLRQLDIVHATSGVLDTQVRLQYAAMQVETGVVESICCAQLDTDRPAVRGGVILSDAQDRLFLRHMFDRAQDPEDVWQI